MEFSYCPNCKKDTGHKRALGWGTFFAIILTGGFWFLALPFYPIRCIICGHSSDDTSNISSSASYAGIGIFTADWKKGAKIIKFAKPSPAREMGLKLNDIIIEIDDVPPKDKLDAIRLRGQEGTKVKIKVLRNGQFKEFEVIRQRIK